MSFIDDTLAWLQALPADFAFLLALPFLVALAGWLRERPRTPRREPGPRVAGRIRHGV
jgi:hypothetical protein